MYGTLLRTKVKKCAHLFCFGFVCSWSSYLHDEMYVRVVFYMQLSQIIIEFYCLTLTMILFDINRTIFQSNHIDIAFYVLKSSLEFLTIHLCLRLF